MIVRDQAGNLVGIHCDECSAPAPPAAEISKGHGLVNMGWHCSGGVHICPNHVHPEKRSAR